MIPLRTTVTRNGACFDGTPRPRTCPEDVDPGNDGANNQPVDRAEESADAGSAADADAGEAPVGGARQRARKNDAAVEPYTTIGSRPHL